MQDDRAQAGKTKADESVAVPVSLRAIHFARRVWRPAATTTVVALAALLIWHVVYGRNGVSVWEQKRVEDRQLRREIDDLNQENARLRDRVERLKTNPDAIGQVARDQLHYAKPNEVIVTLPPDKQTQTQPTGAAK
ncbi:MAG: septum formation initiator family protein [Terracidiphilus sp.]|jgi:cell division protein FtsB